MGYVIYQFTNIVIYQSLLLLLLASIIIVIIINTYIYIYIYIYYDVLCDLVPNA